MTAKVLPWSLSLYPVSFVPFVPSDLCTDATFSGESSLSSLHTHCSHPSSATSCCIFPKEFPPETYSVFNCLYVVSTNEKKTLAALLWFEWEMAYTSYSWPQVVTLFWGFIPGLTSCSLCRSPGWGWECDQAASCSCPCLPLLLPCIPRQQLPLLNY